MRLSVPILTISLLVLAWTGLIARAENTVAIPNYWDPQERVIKPNLKGIPRLRFLTVTDFPPFSFVDSDKRLVGFHIDLARAICEELEIVDVCQIQALPFEQHEAALRSGGGEALMSGLAINNESRRNFLFTKPYFRLPARLVVRRDSNIARPAQQSLAGKSVGIVTGTTHAAFAQAHFSDFRLRQFVTLDDAQASLKDGSIDAVFGDALTISFWLQDSMTANDGVSCCAFVGGPYFSEVYFGHGLAIAVLKDNTALAEGLDYALRSINDKGIFAELYLRYFPISLY